MKGSVVKRGNKYSIVIDLGRDNFGKRKQRWFSGYNTKKEAERELPRLLVKIQDGELLDINKSTLEQISLEWLEQKCKRDALSPTTIDGYKNIIHNHIIPTIGSCKIQDIKPYTMQKYIDLKSEKLSNKTISNHNRVLTSIMLYALDMELIDKNPMIKVKLPRGKKKEIEILNLNECNLLLDKVRGNKVLEMPVTLALLLGLRRGECLALSWDDIDYKNKQISIRKNLECVDGEYYFLEPKTHNSKRIISIPDMLIPLLKQHYKWQREMTIRSGGVWKNENNLVCTTKTTGSPVRPTVLSDTFRNFLIKNNLKQITFHGLRHTNASLMIAANVPAKVASSRLGHSNISITLDLYSHVMKEVDMSAAEKINNLLVK